MSDNSETEVSGTVEAVVYHQEETGYTVCSVKSADGVGEAFTLVGNCSTIWEGEEVVAKGTWGRHPQHGRQFQAKEIRCIAPTSAEGICRFLSSGMIKGIGKGLAKRVVDKFGIETLHVIEKESQRLEEVEGIGSQRRKVIRASWMEQRGVRDIMIFLQSNGIGTAQAARIYRQYGGDAIAVVKRNPYRLCEEVWGIGFKTADEIAMRVGVERESRIRARAGLSYVLGKEEEEGHCYCDEQALLLMAQEMLGIPMERLMEALKEEVARGALVSEEGRIYLKALHVAECGVAARMKVLMDTPAGWPPIASVRAVEWAEKRMGFLLAPGQRNALEMALTNKVSVITGGPGVGKTTLIRALVEIFGARKLSIALTAPTGRAAKRLSESTGTEAVTIHRLLKFKPQGGGFTFNDTNLLPFDVYILDEASMIDILLAQSFLNALPATATVVWVGDTDQLPSVGPGNVLADILKCGRVASTHLTAIFRQDTSGLIVRNAHHIHEGEMLEAGGASDFFMIETSEPDKVIERVVDLVTKRIPQRFGFDPMQDVQVLTPMRRGALGTEHLNAVLQAALNPDGDSIQRGGVTFRQGDRVMQVRNNYDKEVYNGDIGFLERVDEEQREVVMQIDGRRVTYDFAELDELTHAYACSIHKSQGSEYPAVVLVISTHHFKLLQRNLLYTGLTRGRKLVCIVGTHRAVSLAIQNNDVKARRSGLSERLAKSE